MEVDHEKTDGSVVSLTKPGKGRKKKSAVAKLVEKKRRNSGCGSEFGSIILVQKEDTGQTESTPSSNKSNNSKNKNDNNHKTDLPKHQEISSERTQAVNNKNAGEDIPDSSSNKDRPSLPKPVPRKLRKPTSDDLEGGTVVSIYDKREKSPSRDTSNDKISLSKKSDLGSKYKNSKDDKLDIKVKDGNKFQEDIFTFLGPRKPRSGLDPIDNGKSSNKKGNVHDDFPPMDLDHESDDDDDVKIDPDLISKTAPSDATVHRFRAMRMTPDRSRSEESLKKAVFAPKPPPTPRSARKVSSKGEKRNRESNSSGEEFDNKKHNSVTMEVSENIMNTSLSSLQAVDDNKMDVDEETISPPNKVVKKGLSLHPNVKEVKSFDEYNVNQNMFMGNTQSKETSENPTASVSQSEQPSAHNLLSVDSVPSKELMSDDGNKFGESLSKKGDKKKTKRNKVKPIVAKKELKPLDGAETPRSSTTKSVHETLGSASDLKAISENYELVLKEGPVKKSDSPRSSNKESVIPEPKSKTGKLDPITPKSFPPPLPQDMKSVALRTQYKNDVTNTTLTKTAFGRSFSGGLEKERTRYDLLSSRSLSASSALPVVSTREARDRMHQGTVTTQLLSSTELDRYFPDRKVGLWIGSWNMAEIKDCKEPLDDFLLPEACEYVQDIYAIGTQENAMNKKEWEILLQETIGTSHVLFHSASHGALHIAIFVKRDLIWFCTVPEDDLVQTRAVTMVKTKGAIAISFQFFGTSFLFINCHFAPGDEKKKERLEDYIKIIKNLNLPRQGNIGSPNSTSNDVTTRFDAVFWMGDLNFRIEVYKGKQAVESIVNYIEEQEHRNFEDLVSGDQLTKLIVEGSIFQGFQEGRINFRPTYKYDIGQDTFDTSSKNRIPSYTDRVLFRSKKKNSIVCTHYDSPGNVKISDHRPVFAIFEVAVQPARECHLPLAAGQFDRNVYTEANRRRSMKVEVVKTLQQEKSTKVCAIQ